MEKQHAHSMVAQRSPYVLLLLIPLTITHPSKLPIFCRRYDFQRLRQPPPSELEATLLDTNNNFTQRYDIVRKYLDSLAKPVGSLGSLEDYGARIAALQRSSRPVVNKPICIIFAA